MTACALFAIAFATTLCHGGDPTTKRYDQRAMRQHLVDCLESSRMTEFPPTDDTVGLVHPVVGKNVPIYCTCRLPNNNAAYFKCCGCCEWYHPDFANIPESAFHPRTKWLCLECNQKTQTLKSNSMQISTKVRQGSKNKNRSSLAY